MSGNKEFIAITIGAIGIMGFLAFLVSGSVYTHYYRKEVYAAENFEDANCTILSVNLDTEVSTTYVHSSSKSGSYTSSSTYYYVNFRVSFDDLFGNEKQADIQYRKYWKKRAQKLSGKYNVGSAYDCWYDPDETYIARLDEPDPDQYIDFVIVFWSFCFLFLIMIGLAACTFLCD